MNRFILVGLLAIIAITSSMLADAQDMENNSLGNSSTNNVSVNAFMSNNTNLTVPESEPIDNVSINKTSGPSQKVSGTTLGSVFAIGTGMKDNSSAYRLGGKIQTAKDLSKMWYVIQGTPHGYT